MQVWSSLGFIAPGMVIAHTYNWLAWRKYYEGRSDRQRYGGKS